LRQAERSRARSSIPSDAKSGGQKRNRILPQSSRVAQGATGGRRIPSLSGTQRGSGQRQRRDLRASPGRNATWWLDRPGKKTAATIHQEIAQEVNQLLGRIFAQRRNSGGTDL